MIDFINFHYATSCEQFQIDLVVITVNKIWLVCYLFVSIHFNLIHDFAFFRLIFRHNKLDVLTYIVIMDNEILGYFEILSDFFFMCQGFSQTFLNFRLSLFLVDSTTKKYAVTLEHTHLLLINWKLRDVLNFT